MIWQSSSGDLRDRLIRGARVPTTLDDVDLRLLELLRGGARQPVSELARRLGVARATAYARLSRLERSGVIRDYAAVIDPAQTGLDVTALILVTGGQQSWQPLQKLLADLPQVEKAWYVTGLADVLLVVRTRDVTELRAVVLERLQRLPGIRGTQTMLALEQVVDRPYVVPVDEPAPPVKRTRR
jgi:Lrp/AsnC family leucine-responsive transcriptional regulator